MYNRNCANLLLHWPSLYIIGRQMQEINEKGGLSVRQNEFLEESLKKLKWFAAFLTKF
jgi:hypothetical protein